MGSPVDSARRRMRRAMWRIRQRHGRGYGELFEGALWERALQRALGWRRVALLRDVVRRSRGSRVARSPHGRAGAGPAGSRDQPSVGDRPWLVPILVDCVGRDGSTLLMRLLATSPQVAVEGPYPFERKYFSYIWRWSRVVDRREWPADRWGPQDLVSLADEPAQPLVGPPPWIPRALIDDRGDPLSRRCFEFAWGEFSRRAAERTAIPHRGSGAEVRYYAEKHLRSWRMDPEALDLARLIVMLRDPRDMYVSAAAFTESRGDTAFGRLEFDAPDHLRKFVTGQRRRLQWIASLTQDCQVCLVAYEDLVRDLEGVARRLSEWLGIDLDPAAAGADERIRRMHVTAGDPERSIGRWKAELPASTAEVMRRELGPQLEALGFEV